MNKAFAQTSLSGHLLVAMPGLDDRRFSRAVIYVCAHSHDGAMGLILNRQHPHLTFTSLVKQLGLSKPRSGFFSSRGSDVSLPLLSGGPVEKDRGFVLHSDDYFDADGTVVLHEDVSLTATSGVIEALASGHNAPAHARVCLGYASWASMQLEDELLENTWLITPATTELVFKTSPDLMYDCALRAIGLPENVIFAPSGNA